MATLYEPHTSSGSRYQEGHRPRIRSASNLMVHGLRRRAERGCLCKLDPPCLGFWLTVSIQEDIDLLTLSCLPQPRAPKQPTQGLPLKAVYRDTVVGIRYLHPPDTSVASVFIP